MRERGQATVEYVGLAMALLALMLACATMARARLQPRPRGDSAYLGMARSHAPHLIPERGDGEQPVDALRCRVPECARGVRPVLYVHAVRRGGFVYLEYWEYLPESRTAHTGIAEMDGYHRDDWEGVIVKLRGDGAVVGARASAHLGWSGRSPWWALRTADWAPYPAAVYRASGSHAGSFRRDGVDLAGDGWDGDAAASGAEPLLLPADALRDHGVTFDPGAVPPWQKQVWSDPESVITGRPGDRARYARYAALWARLCPIC
jgi:hypothetical protein